MAYRVDWSTRALDDIEEIARYIEKDSPLYARAVVTKMVRSTAALADFPFSGRIVPELNQADCRELFIYSYRVIYRVRDDAVLIVAIIHGKRLLSI